MPRAKNGQQMVPILKKTTELCPFRSYYFIIISYYYLLYGVLDSGECLLHRGLSQREDSAGQVKSVSGEAAGQVESGSREAAGQVESSSGEAGPEAQPGDHRSADSVSGLLKRQSICTVRTEMKCCGETEKLHELVHKFPIFA